MLNVLRQDFLAREANEVPRGCGSDAHERRIPHGIDMDLSLRLRLGSFPDTDLV